MGDFLGGLFDKLGGALGGIGLVVAIIFLVLVLYALWMAITRLYRRVPPNKALIIYGRGRTTADVTGRITDVGFRIVSGGGAFVRPFFEETAALSLEIMTIPVTGDEVKTTTGVPIYVDWVAQVKIGGDVASIATAAQVFLGQPESVIIEKARQTLSGNMREVISGLTVEEVHRERDKFIGKVQQIIADEMALMGLKLVSLTIQDIYDRPKDRPARPGEEMGYFEALAAENMANVRRAARIAKATADREAREAEARQELAARQAEISKEASIAEAEKTRNVLIAQYKAEADTRKAEADRAYDLQDAEIRAALAQKDGTVEVERQRQAGLAAEQAVAVAQRRTQAEVVVPAEAAKKAAVEKATGEAEATKLAAGADAERTRVTKGAEASGLLAIGQSAAEAEKAKLLAQAEGERQLAEARAAQDEINLRLRELELKYATQKEIGIAMANALGQMLGKVNITYVGSPTGDGSPLTSALMGVVPVVAQMAAQVQALTGKPVSDVVTDLAAAASGQPATQGD